MNTEFEFSNGILNARLSGDIDHHSAKKIREDIDFEMYKYSPETMILDLGNVAFMDSSGLGLILGRYTKINTLGGKLKIKNPTAKIEEILILSGTDKLVEIIKGENKK